MRRRSCATQAPERTTWASAVSVQNAWRMPSVSVVERWSPAPPSPAGCWADPEPSA
ncbi:hypothetical protein BFJ63_vAg19590 [Fusarium oxysporum f. sp. narcissi]|uniref:Uncharacterized protein n=1 Tax=Fusarium oxysporum f. sp. narcissi TaxID=451672 RepID=A0A4Q2UTG9_FUSOX|nr:hypothetical protein BFJ63_vAg19590 [Fusarium oxysporum f. sp. narcissi]